MLPCFDSPAEYEGYEWPQRAATLLLFMLTVIVPLRAQTPNSYADISHISIALAKAPLPPLVQSQLKEEIQNRQYRRVEKLLLETFNKNPRSSPLLALLGEVFFLDGKYLNCAIAMKKADALSAIDGQSRFTLAMAYIATKRFDWARPELEKLARENPHRALYPYWISRLDYHAMHLSEAVANVRKAIDLDPRFMKAYDNLGVYYEGLGKYQDAADAYRQALRLNREEGLRSPWPAFNLGALLSKLGQLNSAQSYLGEALSEDSRFPKAHFQLGILLEKEKKDAEAIQELGRAIAFDPSYAEPYFALGKIFERQHQPRKAHEAFRKFQELKKGELLSDLSD